MIEGYLRRLGLMDAGGPVDYLDPQRMNLAKSWPTSGAIDSGINPQMTRPVRSSFPNPADYADEPPSRIGQAIDDYRAGKRDDTGAMLASAATNVASMPLKMMTLEGMYGLGKSAYDAFMTPYRVLTSPEPVTTEQMIEPAANIALTAPLGGAAIGKAAGAKMVEDNAAGIFGGRLARTADHAKLAQAEDMAGKGVPREQIWNDTGWFQGVDGKWRFEIDDSGATYQGGRRGKLSSIMDHPDLYDAYPEAGRAKVYPRSGSSGGLTEGLTGPIGNRIIPHQIEMGSRTDPRKAFLHESQHIAQAQEGFSRGANLKDPDYWGNLGEQEARAVEKRADLTPSERAKRPPWLDYSPLYSNSKEGALPGLLSGAGQKQGTSATAGHPSGSGVPSLPLSDPMAGGPPGHMPSSGQPGQGGHTSLPRDPSLDAWRNSIIEDIAKRIEGADLRLDDIGLRAETGRTFKEGEYLPKSRVWDDGAPLNEELNGTSTIGLDRYATTPEDVAGALHGLGNYEGDSLVLVGGRGKEFGVDSGEHVIRNAQSLGQWPRYKDGMQLFSNSKEASPLSLLSQGKDTPQGSQAADPYREALRMKARAKALGINP